MSQTRRTSFCESVSNSHQNQNIGFTAGQISESNARLLSTRQISDKDGVSVAGQAKPTQHSSRVLVVQVEFVLHRKKETRLSIKYFS